MRYLDAGARPTFLRRCTDLLADAARDTRAVVRLRRSRARIMHRRGGETTELPLLYSLARVGNPKTPVGQATADKANRTNSIFAAPGIVIGKRFDWMILVAEITTNH